MQEELLTPQQVADWFGITVAALAQMRYLGEGPTYIKLNSRNIRYRTESVQAWLENRPEIISREKRA